MKIVVVFLKVGCSISGIAAALWIFRVFGPEATRLPRLFNISIPWFAAELFVLIGALCIVAVVVLVWARAFRIVCAGLIVAGIVLPWVAFAIDPDIPRSGWVARAAFFFIGAVFATGAMALAGAAVVLEKRILPEANLPSQTG